MVTWWASLVYGAKRMEVLLDAARVNLALAIQTLVGLSRDFETDAPAVAKLLGGYDHVVEANTDNIRELLFRVTNGY